MHTDIKDYKSFSKDHSPHQSTTRQTTDKRKRFRTAATPSLEWKSYKYYTKSITSHSERDEKSSRLRGTHLQKSPQLAQIFVLASLWTTFVRLENILRHTHAVLSLMFVSQLKFVLTLTVYVYHKSDGWFWVTGSLLTGSGFTSTSKRIFYHSQL